LGKTPQAARGVSVLFILIMVMLGGAWMPTFLFPPWLQQLTPAFPTRWGVDGFEAMTWRGLGFTDALTCSAALLGFAVFLGSLAVWRFRWEES
jgi:ABC-2 type transport system permease protein